MEPITIAMDCLLPHDVKGGWVCWWKQKNRFKRKSLLCSPLPWWWGVIFVVSFFFGHCSTPPLKVGRCRCCCPRSFVPQGKLFFCPRGLVPQGNIFVVRPHPWRLGVVIFVVPMVLSHKGSSSFVPGVLSPNGISSSFDRTLEGWALSLLLSPGFRPPRETLLFCSLGFCPPREAGAASMIPRLPEGVGQQWRSDVGTYVNYCRRCDTTNEGRCCAKASTLFSWHGGGERAMVIYIE